jgi:DnaJ-class molecular chaperone
MSRPKCEASPAATCKWCHESLHQCVCDGTASDDECPACGGEGVRDGHEEDPSWFSPGEMVPCGACGGKGWV